MNSHERKEEHALFWYRLVAPLLDDGLDRTERSALIHTILSKDYKIPGSKKTRISRATLFRKLVAYRRFGLKGLIKPDRADKGASHSIKPEWVNKAIELRLEGPHRSTRRVIDMLEHHFALGKGAIKHNTLARVFKEKKLTRKILKTADEPKGLTRFGYRHINELWMSDVMHGIPLPDPRDQRKRKMTYLISVIDDASRLIPHGEFYFDEKLPRLENTLKKALVKRGIPVRLYTDNGAIFQAKQFELICAELRTQVIYGTPGHAPGHGKIEKWHLTVQMDFLEEARLKGPQSLEELNRWFFAWLEIAYHHKPHSALGQTPIAFWMKQASRIRLPDPDALDTVFLWRQDRLVSKVHTFQLMGNLYEVPPELSGRTIEIRFNPFDLSRILVFENGAYLCRAQPASLPQPRHPKAPKPLPRTSKPLSMSYLDTLLEKYEQHLKAEFGTLDFQKIESKRKASMEEAKGNFVEALQQHLGRRLGSVEIAAARGLHDELAPIDCALVTEVPRQAVPNAVAFGKFLSHLRSLILKRRQSKGGV
jgi:transposase InsO family protein